MIRKTNMRLWEKKWRDKFNSNDRVEGMGDQIEDFQEQNSIGLTGSPKRVKFIRKDETNFHACKKMGLKW